MSSWTVIKIASIVCILFAVAVAIDVANNNHTWKEFARIVHEMDTGKQLAPVDVAFYQEHKEMCKDFEKFYAMAKSKRDGEGLDEYKLFWYDMNKDNYAKFLPEGFWEEKAIQDSRR